MSGVGSPRRLVAILGPTASGKSELALDLAEEFDGEIVNYDSVQVYRGFDIGSAKTLAAERRGVAHHLLDVLEPHERFSAGEFARRARAVVEQIAALGRLPILVGGTGFYLRALLAGLFPGPAGDEAIRRRLARIAEAKGDAHLHAILARLDRRAAERIHPHDTPKVIRAIEVRLLEGRPLTELHERRGLAGLEGFEALRLALEPERSALYLRIERRTRAMFDAGLIGEVRALLEGGTPEKCWPFATIGYRQALAVVRGRMTVEEAQLEVAQATRNYAKRQLTWLRNQEPSAVKLAGFGDDEEVRAEAKRLAREFLADRPSTS